MRNIKNLTSYFLLIVGVIVLLNIISDSFFFRLDFTGDKRYTLSGATKDILKSLKEPVTVKAYFSENLPPDIAKSRRDFKEMLVEYSNISKGRLVFEFINPNQSEDLEREAMQNGIQPVIINVRDKDQVKQQKAYLGAVVKLGENSDAIPFFKPGSPMEFALTTSIKKLSIKDKPVVGLLQGHNEAKPVTLQQVYSQLSILYSIEEVKLPDTLNTLFKCKALMIVNPTDSFPPSHLAALDNYLERGGRVFIAYNRVNGDLSTVSGVSVNTGLERWLASKGLTIEDNFIIDANCGNVAVQQQQGMFNFTSQIAFPYIAVINTFESHPITKGLESVIFAFASSITYTGSNSSLWKFTPIARTSQKSGVIASPIQRFDINKQWTDRDFNRSNIPVAAVLEKNNEANASKIVVITNGSFAVNGEGRGAQQLQPDNVNLICNSVDWLADDTGLIDLRTKEVTSRPLDQIDDGKKIFLKYLNFLLPVMLIIGVGIFRMQRSRSLRIKRMEAGYV
ncbi:MAG: GldG family protein [Bacteroidales bacterium]|nr:GldG family protein [Bacteroidales bacterium]